MRDLAFTVHTFGCKVNTYDSGLLEKRMAHAGFQAAKEGSIHILNTCAVTAEATREAVRHARRIKAKNPNALVVVTGCAAQVDTEQFASLPGVDLVVANSHKADLENLIWRYYRGELRERVFKSNIFKKEDLEPGGGVELGHTRSFLKIQDGCDSFCTFCVIPFARGKSRSIQIADLVQRVNQLVGQNVKEVVLTGVHIGDYRDGQSDLSDLVATILAETDLSRLRLSSLEPVELNAPLLKLFENPRLCAHFHMSIQSANSEVLKAMKRQYSAEQVESALLAISQAQPGAFVGMDVIAGFPGETEEQFLDSYQRLDRLPWSRLHVFPYSQRPGTVAARSPEHLQPSTIHARARRLRELSDERLKHASHKQIGQLKSVLVLRDQQALSRDYWSVLLPKEGPSLAPNQELFVNIVGVHQDKLMGVPSSH